MANVSRVNGFRPVGHLNGAPFNGKVGKYCITAGYGTSVFVGDLVVLAGAADADGVATVHQAAANGVTIGPVVWFEPNPDNLGLNYRPANTLRYCYVADSPDLVMEAQEDAVGGALATTAVGLNVNFIVGTGSVVTGQSAMQVDSNTANTTNTLPLRIMGFVQRPDNEVGVANAKVLVSFNTHQFKAETGSTGI